MLRSLHIENIAVIRRADLDLEAGFSALTGETGAGKSMIIDSINLLLGNRVPREIIRTGETRALVSAVFEELSPSVTDALEEMGFECEDGTVMLQRTLSTDGRAQTRLNGQVITQSLQREIARMLISIHGQSDNQKLLQKSTHRALLDAYARPDAIGAEYARAYAAWRALNRELESVSGDDAEKLRRAEMLRFQMADIDALKLRDGEEEALTAERDRLLNYERINKQVRLVYRALRGGERGAAADLLARSAAALRSLEGLLDGVDALCERLYAVSSEVEDIAELVQGYADEDGEDPVARIDRIEERLDGISKLKRKYGATVGEILAFRERAAAELDRLELSDERRASLEKEARAAFGRVQELAASLTAERRAAAEEVTREVTEALTFLDMPKVRFSISIEPCEPAEHGADEIEFMIATNPGEPLMPMIKIASGGELSRIMLALRSVLNDRDGASTVIFDEVDTGVSGKTARKVGMKLLGTSKHAQVLCVTHSAQIASLADTHYRIQKSERDGRAETTVERLDGAARIEEIARILGGIDVTDTQRAVAREMIAEYREVRG
jgi:DNA repair protein RecN (Recombination protein N)